MKHTLYIIYFLLLPLFVACTDKVEDAIETGQAVPMYPDYTDVTIPKNIAPLNFLLRGDYEEVSVEADGETLKTQDGNKMQFDLDDWHDYLQRHAGKTVEVRVYGKKDGRWQVFKPFTWTIARDTIDPVLTYRLIEPDYEVWNHLQIQQRDLTGFDTKQLGDWRVQENRCMNCHAFANRDPQLSMEYVRGKGGGAILNDHGVLRKLNIKAKNATDSMVSSSVYYGFSPSGRYVTFSTNVIIPAFHARPSERLEVYDTKSDVYVADLKTHKIFSAGCLPTQRSLRPFRHSRLTADISIIVRRTDGASMDRISANCNTASSVFLSTSGRVGSVRRSTHWSMQGRVC